MKRIFLLSLILLSPQAIAQDMTPTDLSCPMPSSVKLDKLYQAFSDKGYIVEEDGKQWKLSNVDEIQKTLDKEISAGLNSAKRWQKEGNFFAKSGKKVALAPVWAIAPKDGESASQTFAPHLKSLVGIGLLVPFIEFKGKDNNECDYEIDVKVQIKLAKFSHNFNKVPNFKFEELE